MHTVSATADFHGFDTAADQAIVDNTRRVVGQWREMAGRLGIAGADVELTAGAFAALDA